MRLEKWDWFGSVRDRTFGKFWNGLGFGPTVIGGRWVEQAEDNLLGCLEP